MIVGVFDGDEVSVGCGEGVNVLVGMLVGDGVGVSEGGDDGDVDAAGDWTDVLHAAADRNMIGMIMSRRVLSNRSR